jgi:hypothetical protein
MEPDLGRHRDVTAHINVVTEIVVAAYGIEPSR